MIVTAFNLAAMMYRSPTGLCGKPMVLQQTSFILHRENIEQYRQVEIRMVPSVCGYTDWRTGCHPRNCLVILAVTGGDSLSVDDVSVSMKG